MTVMDCSVRALMVRAVDAENPPVAALMVVDPLASPVARPPGDVIVATDALDEVHTAADVRSRVLPSL
jgi:hypothetical protein